MSRAERIYGVAVSLAALATAVRFALVLIEVR